MSLKNSTKIRIKKYILEKLELHDASLAKKVADNFGVSLTTVYRYIHELEDEGLIVKEKYKRVVIMEVKYSKAALKFLAKSDKATVNRIRIGIEGLKINPPKGDIKLMQGFDDGRQRLRIGKYRIIFKRLLDGTYEIIYIMDIGSRGDIYK